jgi:hypothetical protein
MASACFECGQPADHDHHVVPRIRGGTKTVPLCGICHGKVHDLHLMTSRALTRQSLARKRARGERVGSVPYGSRLAADGVHLEADPVEAQAVQLIRDLRASGRTLRAIAAALEARGIPPRGQRWHATTIGRALSATARVA